MQELKKNKKENGSKYFGNGLTYHPPTKMK